MDDADKGLALPDGAGLSPCTADSQVELTVVSKRCVYLNDFRIAGNKPYVSEDLPQHHFIIPIANVLKAMPMLALRTASDPALGYLNSALEGFTNDPADSDYQRGYEAALREMLEALPAQIGGAA